MKRIEVIGNLGANAEVKSENGQQYLTFRVADSERWTDANGTEHEDTTWITCFWRGNPQNLLPYLTKGTKVFCRGRLSVRIYDSAQDHCKKVGISMNVSEIELCGGASAKPEAVPAYLYDDNGEEHPVSKFYWTDTKNKALQLKANNGQVFTTDKKGFIKPVADEEPI